jgi:hypothetical protein
MKIDHNLVHKQALHQWRYIWDGDYRDWYHSFLSECGISLYYLIENKVLMIPVVDDWVEENPTMFDNNFSDEAIIIK